MTIKAGVYPVELEAEVATRDGSLVHVRPVRLGGATEGAGAYGDSR